MRVGLISNAASGRNRGHFARIRRRIDASPVIHHIVTADSGEIPAALARLREADIGLLAINGGDGTAAAVLGQLLEGGVFSELPVIALLPGGTANMTAGDVGLRGTLMGAVARFCRWCEAGARLPATLLRRPLLRLRSAPEAGMTSMTSMKSTASYRYGMFLGGGIVMQGTEYAHREIHSRGLGDDFSLLLGTVRTLWGVHRGDPAFNRGLPIEIAVDGGAPRHHNARILALSTLERLAFGMRPFWGTGPGPLRLTVMEQGCTRFIRTFSSIARGKPSANAVPESGYFSCNASGLTLRAGGALNLDGEIFAVDGDIMIDATCHLNFLRL